MRRLVADCAGRLLWPITRQSLQGSINVVYYHYVGCAQPHYAPFYRGCTTAKFASDLRELKRIFDFAPLDEIVGNRSLSHSSPRPLLALTFDDGFDLRNDGAMDVLDDFGIKATMFVVTAVLGNRMLIWRHMLGVIQAMVPDSKWRPQYMELAAGHALSPLAANQSLLEATYYQWEMDKKDQLASELWERCGLPPVEQYLQEKRPYLSWEGIREWVSAGHSVGFHTHTHPFCSRLNQMQIEAEVIQPAREFKNQLGLENVCFSYPFGDRLAPVLEHKLFEKGLFGALFGTKGFVTKGTSNQTLERLGLEGLPVEQQLRSERFCAFRRDVKKHWAQLKYSRIRCQN